MTGKQFAGVAIGFFTATAIGPALADNNSVELDCKYHVTSGTYAADRDVHIGVDFANNLVRVYSASGEIRLAPVFIPSTARIEGDHVVYPAAITEDTISWSANTVGGPAGALLPSDVQEAMQVAIDRKTGRFSVMFDPRMALTQDSGSCTKRSDTNKF
ncbi:MAG TPA: hypothetical protein VMD53_17955 [Rhizomicrobium sp.]|nr:hypothetical protein [Rhizomicrobium sp.]